MNRGRRDIIVIALALAGVIGALSLAGIFVVYLIDTIGDDGSGSAQPAGTTGPTSIARPPVTGATGPTLPADALGAEGGQSPPAGQGGNPKLNRIPDNQVYETFRNTSGGYSILFPKGWDRQGSGNDVTFRFGRSFVHVFTTKGGRSAPDVEAVSRQLDRKKRIQIVSEPRMVNVNGDRVVKATFLQLGVRQASGAPVRLFIDQYHFFRSGRGAVLDLATTGAVRTDNADDFEKIAQSFRWT